MAQIPQQQQQLNRSTPIQLMQQQTQNVAVAVNSPAAAAADSARKQRHIAGMGTTTSGPVMAVANPAVAQQMEPIGKTQNKTM